MKGVIMQGWGCPKCGAVMNPNQLVCVNCTGKGIEKIDTPDYPVYPVFPWYPVYPSPWTITYDVTYNTKSDNKNDKT